MTACVFNEGGKTLVNLAVFNRVRTISALDFNELCW